MREIKFRIWDGEGMITTDGNYHFDDYNGLVFHSEYGGVRIDVKLMQYTGLKDKNGKEIYEGDIITDGQGDKRTIVFRNGWFCAEYPSGQLYMPSEMYREIIGNIYENPDLLSTQPSQE